MKILVVTPTFFPIMGGAEVGISEIYRRLIQRHEVRILTPWPDKILTRDYGIEESLYHFSNEFVLRFKDRVNLKKWPGQWKLKGIIPPFSLSTVAVSLKSVRKFKPEIVNMFYPLPTGLAAVSVERLKKTPTVLSIIGRDIPGPNIPSLWKNYAKSVSRAVSERIYISEYCRKALFGPDSDDGEIIPFGVDTDKFKPDLDGSQIKKALKIPVGMTVLFALQRLDQWKRVDVIIQAMKYVLKKKDVFLVIGGKGSEKDRLVQMTEDLGLSSRIFFTGYIKEDDLPLYYAMADLFVFHSTYETFGVALLQAMAAGIPIVTIDTTAIPELIHHNQNGILVEPLDPSGLADAVVSLLEDKGAMVRFSEESRKIIMEKYDWDCVAASYEKVFHRCLQ